MAEAVIRRAVILAGGKGTRLHPLTFALPKPLVPVSETPIIDIIMRQLAKAGVRKVTVAAGHMADILMAYLTGNTYGRMEINFHVEQEPLGTAGPLAMIPGLDERFFVLNGDLLTSLNYHDLAARHADRRSEITVAAYRKTHEVGLGVLRANSAGKLLAYLEKPSHAYLASMGIYAMEPSALDFIKPGERLDLPGLACRAIENFRRVYVHEFSGYWRDIGTPEEYAQAQEDFREAGAVQKLFS